MPAFSSGVESVPAYRVTTFPTGTRKGPWRDTRKEAVEDAIEMGLAAREEFEPHQVYLDAMAEIEKSAE